MQTGVFVPGGTADGISHYPDYPITDRHTAYEWAMALGAEVHPYAHCIADLFGDLTADTLPGKEARERAVETWPSITEGQGGAEQFLPKAIYYTLKAEFDTGRLKPLRPEWCTDRPGIDPPDVLDFSRCVFGIEQVLPLLRRRGDTGRLIGELLAAADRTADHPDGQTPASGEAASIDLRRAPDPEIHKAITKAYDDAKAAGTKPPNVIEIINPVQALLRAAGYQATGLHIRDLASADQHKKRRRKPGKTIASEKRS
jgi:hypothetical protein